MKKEVLKKSTLGEILWTLMIGTLSHFFYQWSGENFFVGLLSPVNETIWEHLKLLFFPALFYMLGEKAWLEDRYPGRFCENLRGLWAGLAVMPVLYLWIYSVYGKGLSLGRYRDFHYKRADSFSGTLFPRATSQADMLACPFGDCREGLIPRCLHRCFWSATCNRWRSVLS